MTNNRSTKWNFLNFFALIISGAAWLWLSKYYFPFMVKNVHAKYFTYWLFVIATVQIIIAMVKLFPNKPDESGLIIDFDRGEKNEIKNDK